MAKLVVRRGGSGRSVRKDVLVRIQFWVLKRMARSLSWLGLFYYRINRMAKLVVRRGGSGRSVRTCGILGTKLRKISGAFLFMSVIVTVPNP